MTMLNIAILIYAPMIALWLYSLRIRDVSIVDIWWGPAYGTLAVGLVVLEGTTDQRAVLLAALLTLWGLRLGTYLWVRNRHAGEDYRYASMRKEHGDRFPLRSLFTVFLLQGTLVGIVSLPVQRAFANAPAGPFEVWDIVGVVVWTTGFLFEAVADLQLAHFKRNPENKGKVMDQGLWRYSRHPNYFGNFLIWWGITAIALAGGAEWWTLIGPVVMSVLLLKVSGVAMLESTIVNRRPAYADYIKRTSAFFPWFPDRAS